MKKLIAFLFVCLVMASSQASETIEAGPIWSNNHAQSVCPKVCSRSEMDWNGQWWTTVQGRMSVCQCEERYTRRRPRPHRPRPIDRPTRAEKFELRFDRERVFRGHNTVYLKRRLRNQHGIDLHRYNLKAVVLVAKSKHGRGTGSLMVGDANTYEEVIDGMPYEFRARGGFDRVRFRNPKRNSRGPWQLHLRGKIKIKKIVVKLKRKDSWR